MEIGGSLVFVRGVSAERVIEAFGMDPARALLLPASEADEALRYPVWDTSTGTTVHPWIRVGRSAEWTFAIDPSLMAASQTQGAVRELSLGTEAAWFSWNPNISYFRYFADGVLVTAFEPLLASDRQGSDPDRFLDQMRRAGLDPDPIPDDAPVPDVLPDYRIGLLDMLTLALGIRLPREVALGPLLTVQR
jgi:hypothetical protein